MIATFAAHCCVSAGCGCWSDCCLIATWAMLWQCRCYNLFRAIGCNQWFLGTLDGRSALQLLDA
eukprot:5911741-Pleurochrysis_carterae.AAC.5